MPGLFKMIIGAVILGIGAFITFRSHSSTIAYGAMIVGAIQLLLGLVQMIEHATATRGGQSDIDTKLQKHAEETAAQREQVAEILRRVKDR